MKSVLPLAAILMVTCSSANAQPQGPTANGTPSAQEWRAPQMMTVLLLGGFAAAASWRSESAAAATATLEAAPFEGSLDYADYYGDGITLGSIAIGSIMIGHLAHSQTVSSAGVDMTRSLLTTSAVVWGFKYGLNRDRPNGGDKSFPSGHTAAAFSVAPVIHHHFGSIAGAAAYGLAGLTGAARMEENRHYLSDVLFGAAIGIAAGRWAVSPSKPFRFLDRLAVTPDGVAMSVSF